MAKDFYFALGRGEENSLYPAEKKHSSLEKSACLKKNGAKDFNVALPTFLKKSGAKDFYAALPAFLKKSWAKDFDVAPGRGERNSLTPAQKTSSNLKQKAYF